MKVLILRGIQGAGKSWFAHKVRQDIVLTTVVSADRFFETQDGYRFDISKLGDAHAACMADFITYIGHGNIDVLVVDNTNVAAWECSPYVLVAAAYKADVAILTIHCALEVAAARNQHGVSAESVGKKYMQISSEKLPPMWRHFYDEAATMEWLRN